MSRVLMLVEGATERAVIQEPLNKYVSPKGVYLYPRVIGKPGHKGGVRKFVTVIKELEKLLKQDRHCYVSTFFDYYALPSDWPGRVEAQRKSVSEASGIIEEGITEAIRQKLGDDFNPERFIPYVQMHELEALLFADPKIMAQVFEKPNLETSFQDVIQECGSCEDIDDNPLTAPSKRIENLFSSYKKGSSVNAHAPIIIGKIGIDCIRSKCPHFNAWIEKLESLAS